MTAHYVRAGAPDVAGQLRSRLPAGAEVSLLAVDGHYTSDVSSQIKRIPKSATHLFVSVGGNDALQYLRTIEESRAETTRFPEAISKLKGFQEDFRDSYDPMIGEEDRHLVVLNPRAKRPRSGQTSTDVRKSPAGPSQQEAQDYGHALAEDPLRIYFP